MVGDNWFSRHFYWRNPAPELGANRELTPEEVDDFSRAADERAHVGFDERVQLGGDAGGSITIPGLKDYTCAAGDIYGSEPTVIKVAMIILVEPVYKFAFQMVIRNFYISRLVFMTLVNPPGFILKFMVRPQSDRR